MRNSATILRGLPSLVYIYLIPNRKLSLNLTLILYKKKKKGYKIERTSKIYGLELCKKNDKVKKVNRTSKIFKKHI